MLETAEAATETKLRKIGPPRRRRRRKRGSFVSQPASRFGPGRAEPEGSGLSGQLIPSLAPAHNLLENSAKPLSLPAFFPPLPPELQPQHPPPLGLHSVSVPVTPVTTGAVAAAVALAQSLAARAAIHRQAVHQKAGPPPNMLVRPLVPVPGDAKPK